MITLKKIKLLRILTVLLTLAWAGFAGVHNASAQLPTANVLVFPSTQSIVINGSASVDIKIANTQDIGGFQLGVVYDSTKLELISLVIKTNPGDFLASSNRTVFPIGPTPTVADAAGEITFGAGSFGANPGPDSTSASPGTLATLTFTAFQSGTHTIQLIDVIVSTSDFPPQQQLTTTSNGSIVVTSVVNSTPTPAPSASPGSTPNPTASPVPSATPASTPPTGTGTLILQVRFQGVVRMPTTGQDDRFVNVVVKQGETTVTTQNIRMRRTQGTIGGNSIVYYTNEVSDPNKLINISPGIYDLYFSGPVHLTKKLTVEVIDTDVNTLNLTSSRLLAGDIRDNNVIDEADYNRLVENFGCVTGQNPPPGKTCPSAGAPFPGDVDFDGEVGVFDLTYLLGNYSLQGQ